jgi:hypothetical protein
MREPVAGEFLWHLLGDLELLDPIETTCTEICKVARTLRDPEDVYSKLMDIAIGISINSSTFGRASAHRNFIDLNRCLWTTQPEEYIRTLLHEVAHIINKVLFNGEGHGSHWRYIASELGRHAKVEGVSRRCGPWLVPSRMAARKAKE